MSVQVETEIAQDEVVHPGVAWRQAIEERKLRQKDICVDLGLSEKHLSQILNGKALPSVDLVVKMADYMGLPVRTMWNIQARYVLDSALRERASTS